MTNKKNRQILNFPSNVIERQRKQEKVSKNDKVNLIVSKSFRGGEKNYSKCLWTLSKKEPFDTCAFSRGICGSFKFELIFDKASYQDSIKSTNVSWGFASQMKLEIAKVTNLWAYS